MLGEKNMFHEPWLGIGPCFKAPLQNDKSEIAKLTFLAMNLHGNELHAIVFFQWRKTSKKKTKKWSFPCY